MCVNNTELLLMPAGSLVISFIHVFPGKQYSSSVSLGP